jgi:Flp pilus assembly protein TadG
MMVGATDGFARARRAAISFGRDRRGIAALEFALIAAPFFFLLFAIIETALVFFISTTLEQAMAQNARDIRTGNFQTAGGDAEQFRQEICENGAGLLDCDRVRIDVRTWTSFAAINPSTPIDQDGELDDSEFGFDAGGPSAIVLVRVFYEYEVMTPALGPGLSNMSGNRRLLTAAIAFRNEPFPGGG